MSKSMGFTPFFREDFFVISWRVAVAEPWIRFWKKREWDVRRWKPLPEEC
jgi:hypothetical protein